MQMKPIETAPAEKLILATDGKHWAVGLVYGPPDYDTRSFKISHYAVCQEYPWEPTLWCEIPDV